MLSKRLDILMDAEIYGDDPNVDSTILWMIHDEIEALEKIGYVKGDGKILEEGTYEPAELHWSRLMYLFSHYNPRSKWDNILLKADHWLTQAILKQNPKLPIRLY
jgi:hypothetical protein